jgi:hypothetical protein
MANQYEQFNVANPYQLQQQELDRRQKMAEILQQQAFEPIQAGSYQGIQAPISPVQGLAKVLQMYLANKNQEGLKSEQKALGEQYRADTSSDIQRLIQGLQGKAATPEMKQEPTASDFSDNPNLASSFAQMQPDQQKAFTMPAMPAKAAGILDPSLIGEFKTPGMQQQALSMYMGQLAPKAPVILGEGQIAYNPTTGEKMFAGGSKSPFGNVNPASFTPESLKAFTAGGGNDFSLLVPSVSADTQARLKQEAEQNAIKLKQEREISDRAFNDLSANQKATLANDATRIGISATDLFFNTGMKAGGVPNPVANQPVAQPLAQPVQQPIAQPLAQPVMQPAPQAAMQAPQAQARPMAMQPQAMPVAPPVSPNQALANALSPKAQQELQVAQLKGQQEAAQGLPQVMQQGQTLISTIDQMIGVKGADGKVLIPEHKGLKDVVGTTIPFEYKPFQGGTVGADFKAMYDQVKGGAFLEAVQRMKGSGAISEIEGTKATAALTEASTAQSPDAFRNAMSKFRDAIKTGMDNAATKAGKGRVPTYNPATGRVE